MKIRKANVSDVKHALRLINDFAAKEAMLARSLNSLYENLRDYFVCEDDGDSTHATDIIGVSALHVMWEDLAEIKSLAVSREAQKRGIGRQLITHCLDDARALGVKRVFALTYVPGFFLKLGFTEIDKNQLPHKIWGECIHCSKFPDCDEQAVIIEL